MKPFLPSLSFGCALVSLLLVGPACAQAPGPAPDRVVASPDNTVRVTLTGNVHPLARPETSQGPVADSLPMGRILLLLKRSDAQEAALQSLLEALQDKSSPSYHKWLTPEDFGNQFGPSDNDIQAVTNWLGSQGFHDIHVGPGRNVIEFSGTAGQLRQGFATQIQNYLVNGKLHVANSSDPQIPAALAPVVSGVVSLHNFPRKFHSKYLGAVRKDPRTSKLQPLFTFPDPNGNGNFYGVGPGDFAKIYNSQPLIAAGNDGTGETIAIVGETNINPQDVINFRSMFGLPANFSASNIILNGMDPGITSQSEEGEADLDTQWSGAVAPGATVKFVVSASTPASAGIDLSALYIIEHNLADVMSESYGDCESDLGTAGNAFYNALWEQAAAQGISVSVSSGDAGSAGCDDFRANPPVPASHGLAVSGLAGTPFNASVGGTDFNQINVWSTYWSATNDSVTGTSALGYIPEIPWNENCAQLGLTGCGSSAPQGSVNIVAGSGGPSSVYSKPTWQIGVAGMPKDNHRDQPDISLFASPGFTGSAYIYCQSDASSFFFPCSLPNYGSGFLLTGGTSAAAPAFAGVMALVNQYAAAHGGSSRQGNPNYVLYALAKKSGASCASASPVGAGCIFNDVVTGDSFLATTFGKSVGTNSVPCAGGSPNCSSTVAGTNGVLVDPNHSTTEAWTAAAGYDMATGLGSLNINNLATSWASASTIPTSTTLTLSPTTGITHGQNENVSVTVNVKANTGSGVPSGDVALIATLADGSTLGVDQFTLTSGSITGVKTQSLPGGTYNVHAHYAGDGTNAPSDSPAVQVTVGKESSQTFIVIPSFDSQGNLLSGNASSVTYGSRYIIRMYVANSSAAAGAGGPPSPTCFQVNQETCPTGSVSLSSGGTAIDGGTFVLNNQGYTRDLPPTLTGGTYSLVASYAGDNSYTASTSAPDAFTVTPAPTPLSLIPIGYPLVGSPFYITVYGSPNVSGGVAPSGTVSLYDGTALIAGPATVSGYAGSGASPSGWTASLQVTLNTGGDHPITAAYSGDSSYAGGTSSPFVIHPVYPTTMVVTQSATTLNYGQSVTITATVTSAGKTPAMTGSFSFNGSYTPIQNPVSGTLSTDASGNQILTATVTTTPQFSENVSVLYSGDSNFTGVSGATNWINVNIPDFALGPASGVSVIPMASQTGSGQISITPLSQMASTVSLALGATSTIAGYTISLSPSQVSLHGSPATAMISLAYTGTAPQPAIRRSSRRAGFIFFTPRSGWWSLSAIFAATAFLLVVIPGREKQYRPALAFSLVCVLCFALGCGGGSGGSGGGPPPPPPPSPTATSITLTTANAKVDQGGTVTITGQISAQHPLTGTVALYDYGNQLGEFAPNGSQVVIGEPGSFFGLGVHQLTAKYTGDTENLPSPASAPLTQSVTGTTTVTIVGSTGGDTHYLNATIGLQ